MSTAELDYPLESSSVVRGMVDSIKEYLNTGDQTEHEEIRESWKQYGAYCHQVNKRLSSCIELLDTGAWYEAVRISELEPDLLDVIQLLDFEQREEWEQIGLDFDWDRLIEMTLDRAELLYEAYEHKHGLASLFQKHIYLNISQSPLDKRLEVMRQLMERDKYSTFWRDDVEALEKVRFDEILKIAEWADQHADHDLLEEMIDELKETSWIAKPTQRVIKGMEKIELNKLLTRHLPSFSKQLKEAYLERDADNAFIIRDAWEQTVKRIREIRPDWRGDPACRKLSEPCLKWLKEYVQQEKADNVFQNAIDRLVDVANRSDVKWNALNNAVFQVERLGKPLPMDIQEIVRSAKLRIIGHVGFIVAISLGGMALVGILLVVLSNMMK